MGTTVPAWLAFVAGALIVMATVLSAIMTLVVPRAILVRITRWVFSGMRVLFRLRGSGPGPSRRATGTWPSTSRSACSAWPASVLIRVSIIGGWERLEELWRDWEAVVRRRRETLKADLEQAWRDFAGWRVNDDRMLLALAALTMAPYAPWSSDRSMSNATGRVSGGPSPAEPV